MHTIEAVIFDMDGLMFDTERLSQESWRLAGNDLGLVVPTSVTLRVIGHVIGDIRVILREEMGPYFPVKAMLSRANEHYQRLIEEKPFPIKPGLIELLDFLEAMGLKTAVATSSHSTNAEKKLRAGGVRGRFPTVVSGDQVANGKPAPDIFLEAARRQGVDPSKCIVLEDSEMGIRGACAAGMRAIMVPDLIMPNDEMRHLTTDIFPSLVDFLVQFRRLTG